jgi:hypothetical protein
VGEQFFLKSGSKTAGFPSPAEDLFMAARR